MFQNQPTPPIVSALSQLLAELRQHPDIEVVSLSTIDGLMVEEQSSSQLSAAVGFLISTSHQSFALMGLEGCKEVTIAGQDGHLLVCRLFSVNSVQLTLSIILGRKTPYHQLLNQYITTIKQILE